MFFTITANTIFKINNKFDEFQLIFNRPGFIKFHRQRLHRDKTRGEIREQVLAYLRSRKAASANLQSYLL